MPRQDLVEIRKPSIWISYWLAFSLVIQAWDAGYCFSRPRSMPGGEWAWIWGPYNLVPYGAVDHIYGIPAFERTDGFVNAQALMNVIEIIMSLEYLYLRHTSSRTRTIQGMKDWKYHAHAPIVGFASLTMTWSKTALYFIQEYYSGWANTGHNTLKDLILVYFCTNGVWVIFPVICSIYLGTFISAGLERDFADQVAYAEWRLQHSGFANGGEKSSENGSSSTTAYEDGVRRTPARAAKARKVQ